MSRLNRLTYAVLTAVTAALMAGCAAHVCACAPGFRIAVVPVYLCAFAGAALVQLGRGKGIRKLLAAVAILALLGGLALGYLAPVRQFVAAIRQNGGLESGQIVAYAAAGNGIALFSAALMGVLFAIILNVANSAAFALLVEVAAILCALTLNQELSLGMAVPGMIAGLAAFGLNENSVREGVRPALAAVAAVLVGAALLFVPSGRVTWKPLEDLAAQVRAVVDDYANFTEQRVAFSIGEKGYDHGVMAGDTVVSVLGGAAHPTNDSVMRVTTDRDLLLRGTVLRTYTGYSWIDDQTKSRYLYFDFTHRNERSTAFGAEETRDNPAFTDISASVEMLEEGASTLFVPAHMQSFSMDLKDAVYYNTAGEIFLTRRVQPGDDYALTARVPTDDIALIDAARAAEGKKDPNYADAFSNYLALPTGIRTEVYNLSVELTQKLSCAAEKAIAIREHLANNYHYTLNGAYPQLGTDFVSWFLLESKEGYCSYFASAMTVMCRAAGIPARYVEGYYVRANPSGETVVTGRNAHAWVEVYLNGLGWVAFDPTARAYEAQNGGGTGSESSAQSSGGQGPFEDDSDLQSAPEDPSAGDEPDPTLPPDAPEDEPESGENDSGDDSEDNSQPDQPENEPEYEPEDEPPAPEPPENRSGAWWILLLIAFIAAVVLAVLWGRKRLETTDPLAMCASAEPQQAALILYRANLTLLAQYGLVPDGSETPQRFAERVVQSVPNAHYVPFVAGVVSGRYSGKPVAASVVSAGRKAYRSFWNGLKPLEKVRFSLRRMLKGIGSTEIIP